MKNLGVYFDTSLTLERQVMAISRACYYHIPNIGHIRQHVMTDICTCPDNILTGLWQCSTVWSPKYTDGMYARNTARLVTYTCKHDHMTSTHELLEVTSRHIQVTVQDPGLCVWSPTWDCPISVGELAVTYHPTRSTIKHSSLQEKCEDVLFYVSFPT